MVRASRNASNARRSAAGQAWPLGVRIRNEAGSTRVDIYDDIDGDGAGGGLSARAFTERIAGVQGALEVGINSCGGDVFNGIAIFNALAGHRGHVTTVVNGLAASIASVIMQAGQDRVVQPGAMVMIHDAYGFTIGNADEMKQMAAVLDKVSGNLASVYADRAGGETAAGWRALMKAETWYTADEAVAAGLADRLGRETAELPASADLAMAALGDVPGRIAAGLRAMSRPAPRRPVPVARVAAGSQLTVPQAQQMMRQVQRALREAFPAAHQTKGQ